MKAKLNYRPCVGIVLIKNRKIFAGQRLDYRTDAWQMPQGGIEENELPLEAAIRELNEETGINKKSVKVVSEIDDWVRYDLPRELVPKLWGGKFIGQKQKWFAMKFLGTDDEININKNSPEFSAWKWMSKSEILKSIVPFKRNVYDLVLSKFSEGKILA